MNSAIVLYRSNVMDAIRSAVPDLNEVNWYDAMFDDDDLNEWSVSAPSAFVAVRDVKGTPHSTNEVNLDLDICVVVVTADVTDRSADEQGWDLIQQIFLLANNNRFGNVNAAVPDRLSMERLRDPVLRKQGVALSVVEWHAGLTIGTNLIFEDYFFRDPATGTLILKTPSTLVMADTRLNGGSVSIERIDLSDDLSQAVSGS